MAKCYKCGSAEAEVGLLCRECVDHTRQIKAVGQSQFTAHEAAAAERPASLFSLERILPAAFIIFILFFLARSFGAFGYGTLPAHSTDSCSGKRRCLVVVLAPWCSACEASIPFVQAVGRYVAGKRDLGLQILISLDSSEKVTRLARRVGSGAQVELEGSIYKALGGGGVPKWGLIDSERTVLKRGSGLPGGLTESHPQFQDYLSSHFGLK